MTDVTDIDLPNTADAMLDERAAWTAPVVDVLAAVSAETSPAIGSDMYGGS